MRRSREGLVACCVPQTGDEGQTGMGQSSLPFIIAAGVLIHRARATCVCALRDSKVCETLLLSVLKFVWKPPRFFFFKNTRAAASPTPFFWGARGVRDQTRCFVGEKS